MCFSATASFAAGASLSAVGFGLVGTSLALLVLAPGAVFALLMVATLALGLALVGPNVATLITLHGGTRTGAALGAQGTANGLGQTLGAIIGGTLLAFQMHAPFIVAAAIFVGLGLVLGSSSVRSRREHPGATAL